MYDYMFISRTRRLLPEQSTICFFEADNFNSIYLNNERPIFGAGEEGLLAVLDILDEHITGIHRGIAELGPMLAAQQPPRQLALVDHRGDLLRDGLIGDVQWSKVWNVISQGNTPIFCTYENREQKNVLQKNSEFARIWKQIAPTHHIFRCAENFFIEFHGRQCLARSCYGCAAGFDFWFAFVGRRVCGVHNLSLVMAGPQLKPIDSN